MSIFSIRLKEKRKIYGITQTELAKKLNVGAGVIGDVERGQRNPSKRLAFKLSEFFETDYLYWLDEDIETEKLLKEKRWGTLIDCLDKMLKQGVIADADDVYKESISRMILDVVAFEIRFSSEKDKDS